MAALLIPAVGMARSAAQKATCLSNLRQIGMGIMAYTDDWSGTLPASRRLLANGDELTWDSHHVAEALYQTSESIRVELNWAQMGGKSRGVFRCPSSGSNMVIFHASSEYGLNGVIAPDVNWRSGYRYGEERCANIDGLRRKSELYLAADTASHRTIDGVERLTTTTGFGPAGFIRASGGTQTYGLHGRHSGGVNMLYCDLHVAYLARSDVRVGSGVSRNQAPWSEH
ncbi:MAG: hypothetical protein PF961_19105 [Planctomycetota bacterium]|nr:hypothetical protein [Planctomycetota bacterium]